MAYIADAPRYGFSFTATSATGTNRTKSVNNVNVAMGGASEGCTPDQVGAFVRLIGQSIVGGTVDADKIFINAQYPVIPEP